MLSLKRGNILQVKAQAVVIPSNNQLVAGPGLSEQAYKFFGEKELHQACQNYLKKKKETLVPYTKVVSTETKNNPYFQYVFHAIVPIFDDAKSEFSESQMMRLLENILNEVQYLNIKSISIPALGCGMNLYPIDSFLIAFAAVFSENLPKFQHVEFNLVLYDQESFSQASIILENLINKPQHQVPQQQYQPPQNATQPAQILQNDKLKNYKEKEQEELKQKKIFKFGIFTDSEIQKNSNQQQPLRFATQNHNQAMQFTRNSQQKKNLQEENNQQNLYQYQEQRPLYFIEPQKQQIDQFQKKIDTHNSQKQSLQRPQDYQYDKNDDNYQQQNQYDYAQKREQDFQQYPPSYQQSPPPQQSQHDQNIKQPFTNKEYEYNMNSQIRKKQQPPQENPVKEDLQVVTDLYLQKSQTYAPVYPDVTSYPPGDFIQSDKNNSSIFKNSAKLPFKYIYLHITIDENAAITSESLLMNLLLNLCKQIYAMHKLIYEKPENKIKAGANFQLTYKVEREISDIINFASPEMMLQQYIANSSDMFSLGLVIYKLIFKKNALPNDQQQYKQILETKQISFQRPRFSYSQDIYVILDKLLTDDTNERLMPYQIVQKLLTLSKDEELQQQWQNYLPEMTKFYKNESIMHQIKQNLKQIVEIANKEGTVQQLKVESEVQVQEGPESVVVFQKKTLLEQKNELEESRKEISQISLKQNQDDSNTTLYSLLNADQNKQLQKQAMEMNDFSQCQIKCVVIPINKKNPESTMPDFLKGDSKFDSLFRGLLDFARMEQEYFIQTFKCDVPIFGCHQVIFVFCPDENSNDGRRIRLQRCYLDILLYAFKCLKVESICLCLDNIFSLLISDKSNLPLENYDIQDIFNSACAEMKPDMFIQDQIKFQGQDWIIARLQTPKLVQGGLTIVVEYRDIVNLKGIDAIVNAANKDLTQGGGVCGAIFKACGQYELRNEIDGYFRQQRRRSVDVSEVVVTNSYNLKAQKGAKYVFHAVGPIYREQDHMMCVNQLQKCLLNILKQCEELGIESIAIPAISTGIYGFPKQLCAEIFKKTFLTCSFRKQLHVYLVTLDPDTHNIFQFVFRDGQYKEMIYTQIENIPTTECLVLPINFKELNTGITKKVFTLGGSHLKNQVEFMVKSQQYPILSKNSIFTCQSFNLKFKGVYNVMFVSGPQKDVEKNLNCLLYGVFNEILDTAFTIKKFQSITVVFMAILQQCLPQEQIETYSGMKSIKIFLDSIKHYQENHNGMIGKITILSNMSDFINECKEFFIQ